MARWVSSGSIEAAPIAPITVTIDSCDRCDANYSLDPGIDKILDDAFQREYDKR
jgi:hypothetical protein